MRWSKARSGNGSDSADASTSSTRVAEPPPRLGEHLRALVDAGHLEATAQELRGDEPRPRRDVEDVSAVARQSRDEEAAPARVLSERERGADAVVRRPERREELSGIDRRHGAYCGRHRAERRTGAGRGARDARWRSPAPSCPACSRRRRSRGAASTSARSTAPTGRGAGSGSARTVRSVTSRVGGPRRGLDRRAVRGRRRHRRRRRPRRADRRVSPTCALARRPRASRTPRQPHARCARSSAIRHTSRHRRGSTRSEPRRVASSGSSTPAVHRPSPRR